MTNSNNRYSCCLCKMIRRQDKESESENNARGPKTMALYIQAPNGKGEKKWLHEARAMQKSPMFSCCPLDLLVCGLEESLNHCITLTHLLNERPKARPVRSRQAQESLGGVRRHWTTGLHLTRSESFC